MNERLKQLAEQAGCKVMDDGEWYVPSAAGLEKVVYTSGVGLAKFAELIVRECGQVLVDNTPVVDLVEDWDKGYDRAMNDCIHHIYEHFGVEQ